MLILCFCVQFLLGKLTASQDQDPDSQHVRRFGRGGVDRPGKDSWCPIHLAVAGGHHLTVKVHFIYLCPFLISLTTPASTYINLETLASKLLFSNDPVVTLDSWLHESDLFNHSDGQNNDDSLDENLFDFSPNMSQNIDIYDHAPDP